MDPVLKEVRVKVQFRFTAMLVCFAVTVGSVSLAGLVCTPVGPCSLADGSTVELDSSCNVKITKPDGTYGVTGASGTSTVSFNGETVRPASGKTWETVTSCDDIEEVTPKKKTRRVP